MSDRIRRLNASLAGRYSIERELGEGGMAIVYLSRDERHDRKVAIKVLRPELAVVLGSERFVSEIRTTANLQHPHILPLFDSGEADGFLFYVMPYVEGETLREKLDREKQLPVDEALSIATKVAAALQAAHDRGVIHRDIKPENILISGGEPLVADFGIARAIGEAGGERLTKTGLAIGTPAYMSPEQATGDRETGPATDVYALGCVLYEMLAGEPPHAGPTAQAILARVLSCDPPSLVQRRHTVPDHVERAVRRSLEPVPADRFVRVVDFAHALEDTGPPVASVRSEGKRWPIPTAAAVLVLAAAAGIFRVASGPGRGSDEPVIRYTLAMPDEEALVPTAGNSLALSPDGATLVYVGPISGSTTHWSQADRQLWIRERSDQIHGRALPGSIGARDPFFAPDGSRLGFLTSGGQIKTTGRDGGSTITVVDSDVHYGRGAAWGEDGFIYYSRASRPGIVRVPASGGTPEAVTTQDLGPEVLGHAWPQPLPTGDGLVFTITRNHVLDDVAVLDFRTGEQRVLAQGMFAAYAESGDLVWVEEDGSLMGAPFDLRKLELSGDPVVLGQLTEGVQPDIAISRSGRLAYATRPPLINRVVWVERDGTETPVDPDNPVEGIRFLALSPDGRRLALNTHLRPPSDDGQIFIKELPNGPLTQLTFDGAVNFRPEWLADGETITFVSDRRGDRDVWQQRVDGASEARLVFDGDIAVDEARLSPDHRWLVYRRGMENGQRDIYALRVGEEEIGHPIIDAERDVAAPVLSPDGRWIAFSIDEGEQSNVYVRPFPEADRQWQVSRSGGSGPVWAGQSHELFFRNGDDQMVAVAYSGADNFTSGPEDVLFSTSNYRTDFYHRSYDVTPDGQRFAMIRAYEHEPGVLDVILVENWFRELRETVANGRR